MSGILTTMGMGQMGTTDLGLLWLIMTVVALMTAWVADTIMERFAFGIVGNLLLLLAGMAIGLYALGSFGTIPSRLHLMPAIAAAAGGAVGTLLLASSLKRFF